jgi:large subunit ribosomal protein L24
MKIHRGDSVIVVTGDAAGGTPRKVIQVLDGGRKLLVEGVNRVHRHVKRGHPKSPQGGRLSLELPIDSSNVRFYCESCNKPARIGFRYDDEGVKSRFCKSCGASAGAISRPKARYASKQ